MFTVLFSMLDIDRISKGKTLRRIMSCLPVGAVVGVLVFVVRYDFKENKDVMESKKGRTLRRIRMLWRIRKVGL